MHKEGRERSRAFVPHRNAPYTSPAPLWGRPRGLPSESDAATESKPKGGEGVDLPPIVQLAALLGERDGSFENLSRVSGWE